MSISRELVLEVFRLSKERDVAVGLKLSGREPLLITTIEKVLGTCANTTTLIVRSETIYGEILLESELPLPKIEHIVILRVKYDDVFYQRLRRLRSNIRTIRQSAGLESRSAIS